MSTLVLDPVRRAVDVIPQAQDDDPTMRRKGALGGFALCYAPGTESWSQGDDVDAILAWAATHSASLERIVLTFAHNDAGETVGAWLAHLDHEVFLRWSDFSEPVENATVAWAEDGTCQLTLPDEIRCSACGLQGRVEDGVFTLSPA